MHMSIARTIAIAHKEIRHIRRDPRILFLTVVAPAFVLFLLGYTFAVDLQLIRIGVLDQDHSAEGRRYLATLTADTNIRIARYIHNYVEIEDLLVRAAADAVVVIPPGFGASLLTGNPLPLQLVQDGSDYYQSEQVYSEMAERTSRFGLNLARGGRTPLVPPLTLQTRALYNTTLKSAPAMVPALMAAAFCFPAIAVALACTREAEQGSYETLLSTPIRMPEYIAGKLIPYLVLGTLGALLAWALAVWWFRVPFRGTLWSYTLLADVFLLSLMSLSMLIGSIVVNQQQAIVIIVIVFFIPTFFLSGLAFPLESETTFTRVLELTLPAPNYVIINRGVFLKGLDAAELQVQTLNLLRISLAAIVASFVFTRREIA